MEINFNNITAQKKEERYQAFLSQYSALIDNEKDVISVLANTSAALKEAFSFFWVGFYLISNNDELVLGPFQGSVACYRIKRGRGVCGTAWSQSKTLIVPDVNSFPGHIACSSESKSEIVVPLIWNDEVKGVLDIDSDQLNTFDEIDKIGLENVVQVLMKTLFNDNNIV